MKFFVFLLLSVVTHSAIAESSAPIRSPEAVAGSERINAEQLVDLVTNSNNVVIIDSRLTKNRTFGYIEGSIGLSDIDTNCSTLKKYISSSSTPTVFYCNGPKCGRSNKAVEVAVKCGYSQLYWFRGGIEEWQQKNYPLVVK